MPCSGHRGRSWLDSVHCTCKLCSVHFTLHTVYCTLYTIHCTLYRVHCSVHYKVQNHRRCQSSLQCLVLTAEDVFLAVVARYPGSSPQSSSHLAGVSSHPFTRQESTFIQTLGSSPKTSSNQTGVNSHPLPRQDSTVIKSLDRSPQSISHQAGVHSHPVSRQDSKVIQSLERSLKSCRNF